MRGGLARQYYLVYALTYAPAFNRSSSGEPSRGRKRPRVNKKPNGAALDQSASSVDVHQDSNMSSIDDVQSTPMSFEAKIALALQGNNWQELQNSSSNAAMQPAALTQEGVTVEEMAVAIDDPDKPPETTAKQKKKKENFDKKIARDTGDTLQLIEVDSLTPVNLPVTWNQDPEFLCSYNWQASTDDTNTIFVPGAPAKWTPPTLPHTLDQDSGYSYSDYNYARQPGKPYEPMFAALSIMNPTYDFTPIDVLADRNNLRVLLEFVQGKANGPFRLDLFTVFNTLIIVRNEGRWWKHADGKSYGGNFEKFFTTPTKGMEDATSHYRAIRYPMGPLNVVCRFEADAYDDGVESVLTESEREAVVSGGLPSRPTFRYNAPIRVLQKGHIVPTSQMVELKTQAKKEEFRPVICQDQLWFGRTSLLYTGPYGPEGGLISRIRFEDATARVKKWEDKNQENLRKLAGLLQILKDIMKKERRPNRAVVLVREDKAGPLTVRSMETTKQVVGREAFQRHWRGNQQPRVGFQVQRGRGESYQGHHHLPLQGGRGGAAPVLDGRAAQRGRGHQGAAPRGRGYSNGGQSYTNGGRGSAPHPPSSDSRGGYSRGGYGRGGHGRGSNNYMQDEQPQ
jgi:hypothetical protein